MMVRNKIALVTGGSRGLGKNTCLKLANKGLDVVLTYNSRKEEAHDVVAAIRQTGAKAAALQLSAENIDSFPAFFGQLSDILNSEFQATGFDYLVNNAGIGIGSPFLNTSIAQFDLMMNTLFRGTYFFTQQAIALLNDDGGIVNISSRLAQSVVPGFSAYGAMKGAIEALTRYQAKELASRGIKVNSVAPGPIATDFNGGILKDNELFKANLVALTALGRLGMPDDIGGVVAFLCTEDARWITAQRIEVSGGTNL